jgi:hypothetical protein
VKAKEVLFGSNMDGFVAMIAISPKYLSFFIE